MTALPPADRYTAQRAQFELNCAECHDVHGTTNIYMVAPTNPNGPLVATRLYNGAANTATFLYQAPGPVAFTAHTAGADFASTAADSTKICQACHTNRDTFASAAATGYANVLGTHPSGAVFTGDMPAGSGVIDAVNSPMSAAFLAITAPAADTAPAGSTWNDAIWNSGAHLQGAGNGCNTCHNVHWDEDNATPDQGNAYLGLVSDGGASPIANSFCEYCHRGALTIPTEMGGGNATTYWNPGDTT